MTRKLFAAALLTLAVVATLATAAVADDAPAAPPARPAPPLLLDPADFGMGATVVFGRIPGAAEVHDLQYLEGVAHVVLQLPAWPDGFDALRPLADSVLPQGADLIVVLPGYPETNAAANAWNMLHASARLVMVVDRPPVDREMVFRLNSIHSLERVIADLPRPSRSGFERLQRPLSFRVVMP